MQFYKKRIFMIHLITKKTPKPGSNFFSGSSSKRSEGDPLFLVLLHIHASIAESYLDDVRACGLYFHTGILVVQRSR